jgi:hypothetical protein
LSGQFNLISNLDSSIDFVAGVGWLNYTIMALIDTGLSKLIAIERIHRCYHPS